MSPSNSVKHSLRNSKISTAYAKSDETNKEKTCIKPIFIDPFGRDVHPNTMKVNVEKPCHDPTAIQKLDNIYLREVLDEIIIGDLNNLSLENRKKGRNRKNYKKVPKTMM
jgi:hypothetical protein